MESALILLSISVVLYILLAPAIGIVRLSKLNARMEKLARGMAALEARLAELAPPDKPVAQAPPAGQPAAEAAPAAGGDLEPVAAAGAEEAPEVAAAAPPGVPEAEEPPADAEAEIAPSHIPAVRQRPAATAAAPDHERSLEETLASRWMIWLGGITVALAAVFLFSYAVEQGWLTPLARVILGLVLGGALLSAGEWTQRAPLQLKSRAVNTDYVPPALSASGIFAIFVSLYAAHAIFGLLGPSGAFFALGLVAYSALALALRQGWFVGFLGILAGYLVPALIEAPEPNAVALFLYLYVLTAGALGVMIWRRWRWFNILAVAGALLWPLIWTIDAWTLADQGVLGVYVMALAATFALLSPPRAPAETTTPSLPQIGSLLSNGAEIGFVLCGVVLLWLAVVADFNAAAFLFLGLYGALTLAVGLWQNRFEGLFAIAAILALAAFLIWPQPLEISPPARVQEVGGGRVADAFGPFVMPPQFYVLSRALWGFAALFGLGGYLSLRRVRDKSLWAGLSAFMPVLLFVIGYWRIGAFEIDIDWAYFAIGLSVVLFLAAASVTRLVGSRDRDVPLALCAAGCTAAMALTFTCLLREAWLTVAIAAEVAALGWIWSRLPVRELRTIAAVTLAVVIVRLVGNPMVLEYQGSFLGLFNWVIYGYGLPALATFAAARLFIEKEPDLLVTLCEIAALGFAFLMVALQIKLWTSGAIGTPQWTLLDQSVQSIWWIATAALLLRAEIVAKRAWAETAGLTILAAAALMVFIGQVVVNSPLLVDDPVGSWPLFNLLGLAYLAPALVFGGIGASRSFILSETLRKVLGAAAGVLVFVYLTLEIRRAFWGSVMAYSRETFPSYAEIYAYSAAWIVFSLAILSVGIYRGSAMLRYASLAVLMVTVLKVFLYDMSDLTGLFRVASFLGLGLSLIGIGRVYQLYVFRPADAAAAESAPGGTPPD